MEPQRVKPPYDDVPVIPADRASLEMLPLFSGLPGEEISRLLLVSTVQQYPPATLLFEEGDLPVGLHVVIDGTVEIFSRSAGHEWGLMLMNAGDLFMPGAVLFDEPYTTSARTVGFGRLLLLESGIVRSLAATFSSFAIQLSRAMAGQLRIAVRQVLDLKSRTAAQRLAYFLLDIADSSIAAEPELPMRKRNLAARLGMTPETLSRTLQILAENGLFLRGRQIIVRDRSKIDRFCGQKDHYRPPVEHRLDVHSL